MKNVALLSALLVLTSANLYAAGSGDHSHGQEHGHAEFSVGEPAQGNPDRVIEVTMLDSMRFAFDPRLDALQSGEVIRFEVSNAGKIVHEFSIGNAEEQKKHAQMMREMPNMKHEDPNTISLEPGQSGSLTWRFEGNDTVVFACNEPGHFEAGMHHKTAIGEAHD